MKKLLLVLLALWAGVVLAQGNSSSGGITGNVQGSAPSLNATNQLTAYKINGTTFGWSATDPGGGFSIFYGQGAGLNAGVAGAAKGFFTCIGYQTCGGAGAGNVNNAVNIENSALGWSAGSLLTTGTFDTALGVGTMRNETTGSNNVSVGVDSMGLSVGTNGSTCVGVNTCKNGLGTSLTAVGGTVLIGQTSSTPTNDVALGSNAMSSSGLTTASFDVVIGVASGNAMTSANNDTLLGFNVGQALTTGASNTLLGFQVGQTVLTTGSGNILLGTSNAVTTYAAATSNELNIGNSIRGGLNSLGAGNLSSCGTTPALGAGSTDMQGTITTGTGATACTLQIAQVTGTPARCVVSARAGTQPAYSTDDNGTNAHLVLSTAAASAIYDYFCPVH